jgi:hypothetical protein
MQLNIIALLAAISTAVSAAPVDGGVSPAIMDNVLVARNPSSAAACCPGSGVTKCNLCKGKFFYICPSRSFN